MDKKQKIIVIVTVFALVLLCGGLTFAYFTSLTSSESASTIYVKGGTMDITYASGDGNIIMENIYPRAAAWVNKSFTVTGNNTTDLNMYYGISLVVDNNSFGEYLSYTLTGTNTSNNGNLIPNTTENQKIFNGVGTYDLGVGSFNKATNAVHTYSFKIFFLDTGKEQNYAQEANFAAHLVINSINPDGSVAYVGQGKLISMSTDDSESVTKEFSVLSNENKEEKYIATLTYTNTYITGDLTYNLIGTNLTNNGTMIANATNVSIPKGSNQVITLGTGLLSDSSNTKHNYKLTINDNTKKLSFLSKNYNLTPLAINRNFVGLLEITSDNKTIYSAVIKQGTKDNPTTSVGTAATTNEGLIKTTDDYGTAYYYRGAVENNYVTFAGMCWRIVRTTGNNDVKLVLYNNDSDNCTLTGDNLAYAKFASNYTSAFNHTNSSEMNGIVDSAFMYGHFFATDANRCLMLENGSVVDKVSTYGNKTSCTNAGGKWATTMYDAAFANLKKSTSLTNLETWYKAKLEPYNDKLADVIWCNDKKVASSSSEIISFALKGRFQTGASMICNDDVMGGKLNKYTVNDTTNGNGDLTYPIGMLTADEIAFAGGSVTGQTSTFYISENASLASWTLTPVEWSSSDGSLTAIITGSQFGYMYSAVFNNHYIRPSIALKGNVGVSGSGSASDPFVVK